MTNNNKKWILLLILSVIWGSSFILIKKSLVGLTPLQVGSLRIIFKAIVISIYSYSSLKEIPKKSWKWIILTAYVGTFFPVYLVSFGQTEIESGLASIITTLTPINTLIIGIIFFSLTFTIKQVVGLVVAFFGGILLLYNGGISPNYNVYFSIFIFFTTVGYGASVNLIKTYLTEISPSAVTAGIFLSILPPAVFVLFYSDFFVLKFDQSNIYESIIFVFLLALFSSAIAQTLFNRFVKLASPLFASAVTYLMPIVAIFWGVIDGEVLSLKQYVATIIILSGVYLVNNKQKTI